MSDKPLPSSFDNDTEFYEENPLQKLGRRLKEEPLIPFGCALTVWALINATKSIKSGDHNRTNRMFRARIYAQGFTLVAMVAGSMYWKSDRQKRKEYDAAVAERKAKEKNEAWIRELEARDDEEKEIRAERERRLKRFSAEKAGGLERARDVDMAKSPVLPVKGSGASSMIDEREKRGTLALAMEALRRRQ